MDFETDVNLNWFCGYKRQNWRYFIRVVEVLFNYAEFERFFIIWDFGMQIVFK